MVFHATLVTYIISLTINSIYLHFDIKGSKKKATLSDYFLILTPIVNTVVSISIIIIESLLLIHSVDWIKIFKKN
jgi:hypothetical protein